VVSLQGRKIYLVPAALTKSAAVAEVARRVGAGIVLAAGDSLLDRDLLSFADAAIRPGHGELAELGWSEPHVETLPETGLAAGEAIVDWLTVRSAVPHEPRPIVVTRRTSAGADSTVLS
jgi:hypothetical protein